MTETFAVWLEIQPEDFSQIMRRQQVRDILDWCAEHIDDEGKALCDTLKTHVTSDKYSLSNEMTWLLKNSNDGNEQWKSLLSVRSWDLAQYLAIFDYIYVSRMLSDTPLEVLLATVAQDDASILSNPDLRAEQV